MATDHIMNKVSNWINFYHLVMLIAVVGFLITTWNVNGKGEKEFVVEPKGCYSFWIALLKWACIFGTCLITPQILMRLLYFVGVDISSQGTILPKLIAKALAYLAIGVPDSTTVVLFSIKLRHMMNKNKQAFRKLHCINDKTMPFMLASIVCACLITPLFAAWVFREGYLHGKRQASAAAAAAAATAPAPIVSTGANP